MTATIHQPISGDVIARSTAKTVGSIALFVLLLPVSIFLIWAYFWGFALPLPSGSVQINWMGAAGGFLGLLVAPIAIIGLGVLLALGEKIVLGSDRLQVQRQIGGKATVAVQIPYRNIANLACATEEGMRFVGIDVADPRDGETFESGSDLASQKKTYGWHFRILGGYQKDVRVIHEMLARRLSDFNRESPR